MNFKDKGNAAIVRSTIDLAHNLGFQVTAEGVEDGATLTALRDLGCDIAQGYHIARPMPAAEIVGWIKRWSAATAAPNKHAARPAKKRPRPARAAKGKRRAPNRRK